MHYSKLIGLYRQASREGWSYLIKTKADENALLEGYWFDWDAAYLVQDFIETFCILPKEKTPFILLPWQRDDIIYPLFGWMRPNGLRRFTRGYIELPKKNTKSTLVSAIGNYMLFGDGEEGAEIYTCANDREQAYLVWNLAADMVESSDELSAISQVVRSRYRIVKDTQSWFAAWSSKVTTKDGPDIHLAIVDELHEWGGAGREFWRKVRYGGVARRQPICPLVITTAGDDRFSLCYEQHEIAEAVLDGHIDNMYDFFPLIYAVDREKMKEDPDYWKTEEAWAEANPCYEITLKKETFESDVIECENNPAEKAAFLRYRLGYWTESSTPYIPAEVWERNGDLVDEESLIGEFCSCGLDLASTDDTTSYVLVFPYEIPNPDYDPNNVASDKVIRRFRVLPRIFCPEEQIGLRAKKLEVNYPLWAEQGLLIPTTGTVNDARIVLQHLKQDYAKFKIKELLFDRHGADWIVTEIQETMGSIEVEPFGQGFISMSAPTKDLYKLAKQGRLEHGNHKVLDWHIANAVVDRDPAGNWKLNKDKSKDKIDAAVSLVMAMKSAVGLKLEEEFSVYGSGFNKELNKIGIKDEDNKNND